MLGSSQNEPAVIAEIESTVAMSAQAEAGEETPTLQYFPFLFNAGVWRTEFPFNNLRLTIHFYADRIPNITAALPSISC